MNSSVIPKLIVSTSNGYTHIYKKLESIGCGGFGKVYKVEEQKTKQIFAMKVIPNDRLTTDTEKEFLKNEIAIQQMCNHPSILKVHDTFTDSLNQYIILEYCPGGSVDAKFKKDGKFNDNQVAEFISCALDALAYIHGKNIIHRDIKLSNFLIGENGHIKLCDFGMAIKYKSDGDYLVSGTPTYLSPEVLINGTKGICTKNDVWALGICVFILVNGYPPFQASSQFLLYEHIKTGTYKFNTGLNISYFVRDFINKTLIKNPDERPSAEELRKHPAVHKRVNRKNSEPLIKMMPVYSVCRFWDLSEKFGFGYLLQDGTVGVVFNDQSRMVTDPHQIFIQYYLPHSSSFKLVGETSEAPVIRKIKILVEFSLKLRSENSMFKIPEAKADSRNPLRYVRHWLRDESRILFRFDNGDVQVNFEDSNKLFVYWNEQKLMVCRGLNVYSRCLNMSEVSHSGNEEEKRRLAIAKKMLKSGGKKKAVEKH